LQNASKINLLIWGNSTNIGGGDVWVSQVKRYLEGSSYKVVLLSDGGMVAGEEKADIVISSWSQIEKTIKKLSPALVIPNWRYPIFGICAKLKKEGYKLKCLGLCHADSPREYYEPLAWYESTISKFIAVSQKCKDALTQYLPHRENDIHYLDLGIEIPDDFEKTYSINPLKLIYFGRIEQKQKRVFDFIKLVDVLESKNINYEFDIIGSGTEQGNLKKRIAVLNSKNKIRLIDEMPHSLILRKLKDYDVFLQVSEYEGQSVSMLEAMAAKLIPCVTKDMSGSWSLIDEGRNGFCVDIGDMKSMASILEKISSMKKKEVSMLGEAAYATVKDKFDIKKTMPKHTEIFELCLKASDREWAHGDRYIMPGGFSSGYFPNNEILGLILKGAFRIVPRDKIRNVLHRLKRS